MLMALAVLGGIPTVAAGGDMAFEVPASVHYRFDGYVGDRLRANAENWLLPAPEANPGMLDMFRLRDRQPPPDLMDWAGEFVGKYLLSAVEALYASDDPRLEERVRQVVEELVALQDTDGYLGPFPRAERLLGHWDLWGHYHILMGLLAWYDRTGDARALDCARRIGDCVCDTYLGTGRRVIGAGAHEMNMAIIHGLARLYRHTREERYLAMAREVEKDWEGAGDYLRAGVADTPFFRTPCPRWESLHDVQGLAEMFAITGDERYRTAFANLWRSIAVRDIHPSGAFSSGEQAVGNPYADGSIETCCTIAWMATCVDMLRLTGDPRAADALELAFWNTALGAQHPSGRWCTYDTPMNGVRLASAHHIVFQARVGTPELNCCSVNGPRGLVMMREWGLMLDARGLVVNYYGPGTASVKLPGGATVGIEQVTDYPRDGRIRLVTRLDKPTRFALSLRVPSWSAETTIAAPDESPAHPRPGTYYAVEREWSDGDAVEVELDLRTRHWAGEVNRQGTAAFLRGPILLAFDQAWNETDTTDLPTVRAKGLEVTPVAAFGTPRPLVLVECPTTDGRTIRLCDFATAGARGTHYAAWIPATECLPSPFHLAGPADGTRIPPGPIRLSWTGVRSSASLGRTFTLTVARDAAFTDVVVTRGGIRELAATVDDPALAREGTYFWRVVAENGSGVTEDGDGPFRFTVDPTLPRPAPSAGAPVAPEPREDGVLVAAELAGSATPSYGVLVDSQSVSAGPNGGLAFDGQSSMARYALPWFPESDYSFAAWVRPGDCSEDRFHQVFSAWCRGMDDPLRVYVRAGAWRAGIELLGNAWTTPPVPAQPGRWTHVCAVKRGGALELYLDGAPAARIDAPALALSGAEDFALGGNPHFTGANEHFPGEIRAFALWARALTAEEVARLAADTPAAR